MLVEENDFIIIEYQKVLKCHQMLKRKKIKLSKNIYIKTDNIIGENYNATYIRNGDGTIRKINENEFYCELKEAIMPCEQDANYDANNQFCKSQMNENAQTLSHIDISNLKTKDPSIIELIQYIVKGSLTFDLKNPFSQEKYLKKKLSKFLVSLNILKFIDIV